MFIFLGLSLLFIFIFIISGLFVVDQVDKVLIERFGKFNRVVMPGLRFKIPLIETAIKVNMQVAQLDVSIETKTEDDVFVEVKVSVQYFVEDVPKAVYKLISPKTQISSYVFDVVRSEVPKMKLDDVFERKNNIADAVSAELSDSMKDFGYSIVKSLVTDINPDARVKNAMNEINAAARLKQAAFEKGEAEKIMIVKQAEAERESKVLSGKGVAEQRKEIAKGMAESIELLKETMGEAASEEVLITLLVNQYLDTIKSLSSSGTNTILLPHSPSGVSDITTQILSAFSALKK